MPKTSKQILFKVSEKEKSKISANAKLCGLSTSEYLRQRALGYEPKPILPDAFYSFIQSIDRLIECHISKKVDNEALQLLRDIYTVLIKPGKENISKWQPQDSGL